MAFTKEMEYKGILINAYAKITSMQVQESGIIDGIKQYQVTLLVNFYTNINKEFDIEQKDYIIKGLTLDGLNIGNYYNELKKLYTIKKLEYWEVDEGQSTEPEKVYLFEGWQDI